MSAPGDEEKMAKPAHQGKSVGKLSQPYEIHLEPGGDDDFPCGAQSGYSERDEEKVTCRDCRAWLAESRNLREQRDFSSATTQDTEDGEGETQDVRVGEVPPEVLVRLLEEGNEIVRVQEQERKKIMEDAANAVVDWALKNPGEVWKTFSKAEKDEINRREYEAQRTPGSTGKSTESPAR